MAVYLFDPDVAERMAEVEGRDHTDPKSRKRLKAYRRHMRLYGKQYPLLYAYQTDIQALLNGEPHRKASERSTTVYGWWGWNRYLVDWEAADQVKGPELVFLGSFCEGPHEEDWAEKVGFRVKRARWS